MASLSGFDASKVEPRVPLAPIPAGRYEAVVTESEMLPAKSGKGRYLKVCIQVTQGEHKGRHVWAQINYEHTSAVAAEIGRAELSALCRSVGVLTPKDSSELHNRPFVVVVGVRKRDDTGEPANIVRGFEKSAALPVRPDDGIPI